MAWDREKDGERRREENKDKRQSVETRQRIMKQAYKQALKEIDAEEPEPKPKQKPKPKSEKTDGEDAWPL